MVSGSLSFLCVCRVSRVRGGQHGNVCVSCVSSVYFDGHWAEPLRGQTSVRQKGRLPGPPPVISHPESLAAQCHGSSWPVLNGGVTLPSIMRTKRGRCPAESPQRPCRFALRPRRLLGACEYTPSLPPPPRVGTHAQSEREIQIQRERERERERETNQTP